MGNYIDRVMFPIAEPTNVREEVQFINNSAIEYVLIERGKDVILFSHGNTCTLDHIYTFLEDLSEKTGYSVFAYEYPPNATEESVCDAVEIAYDFLKDLYTASDILLMGHSIGSGPTMWLAPQLGQQIRGVVLVSPITSVRRQAADYVPVCGSCLSGVIDERFDNLKRVKSLDLPLLIVHGKSDQVVDCMRAKELSLMHRGELSQLFMVDDYDHGNIMDADMLSEKLVNFVKIINS